MGLSVFDILAGPLDERIFQNETTVIESLEYNQGGDAFNVAVGVAKLGIKCALISRIGNDPPGVFLRNYAKQSGIDVDYLITDNNHATATSLVIVNSVGERNFVYYPGANNYLGIDDLPKSLLVKAKHLHISGAMLMKGLEYGSLKEVFRLAKSCNCTTSLDVASDPEGVWLNKIKEALDYVDYFLPSQSEAEMLTGEKTPELMANILSFYPIKTIIIKLGENGCYIKSKEIEIHIPSYKQEIIKNTNGAGDNFVSVFISLKTMGYSDIEAAKYANAGASMSTQHTRSNAGFKSIEDISSFINAYELSNNSRIEE